MWDYLPSEDQPCVISYVDDILITAHSWAECLNRTQRVFQIIQDAGFQVNPQKAQLVLQQIQYLEICLG